MHQAACFTVASTIETPNGYFTRSVFAFPTKQHCFLRPHLEFSVSTALVSTPYTSARPLREVKRLATALRCGLVRCYPPLANPSLETDLEIPNLQGWMSSGIFAMKPLQTTKSPACVLITTESGDHAAGRNGFLQPLRLPDISRWIVLISAAVMLLTIAGFTLAAPDGPPAARLPSAAPTAQRRR